MLKGLIDSARRWMSMIFGKSKKLNEIIETQIGEDNYKLLDKWKAIYSGYYEEWHKMKYHTVLGEKKRRRHSLNMAKVAAEEMSKLIFTEKVEINISNAGLNKNINDVFAKNRFYKVFQNKVEQMLALGGLVLKAHPKQLEDGTYKLTISYVSPDCFVPISWENDEVTEGAFLKFTKKEDKIYYLIEFHRWKVKKIPNEATGEVEIKRVYEISNELYEGEKNSPDIKRVPLSKLYPELQEVSIIENLTQPLFQYIKPNIANNFDLQSPLGISIYGNSLDVLYAIDVAFDSFIREFKLGKRRIIVPSSAVKTVVDPTSGELKRYFDADDEIYQGMNMEDPEKQKVVDSTVALRVDEHVAAINALLNLYSMQTGFSSGTFTFDGKSVKTATEVVSENSKTYNTILAHANLIEEGLIKFVATLAEVGHLYEVFNMPDEFTTEIAWDDSIIGDKYTDADFYIKLNHNQLVTKKYVLMKILKVTEKQAEEMLREFIDERNMMNPQEDEDMDFGDSDY